MPLKTKHVVFGALGAGLLYGAYKAITYAYGLVDFQNRVQMDQSVQVSINKGFGNIPTGINATIQVNVKNPTQTSLTITQPFIELLDSNDKVITTSQLFNKEFSITPLSTTPFDPINLSMTWLNLGKVVPGMVENLMKGEKAVIKVRSTVFVNKVHKSVKTDEHVIQL